MDGQLLPPPKKKKVYSQIGCLSFLEALPLGANPIPVLQLILYVLTIIFGMLVCIPMGITLRRFMGSCILWAQFVWDGKTIWPWAETSCDYLIYMNLSVNVIFAVLMCLFIGVFLLPKYDEEEIHGVRHLDKLAKYSNNYVVAGLNGIITAVHCIIWAANLAGAIVLCVGFNETCKWLEKALREEGNKNSCSWASRNLDWSQYTIIRDEDENGVKGRGFYAALLIATIASWIVVFLWTVQLLLNFGQMCTRCSCEIAEEKVKLSNSTVIAARRSRLATPIGTPGGRHTPVPFGQPMMPQQPYRGMGMGAPPPQQQTYLLQQPPQRYPGQSMSSEA